MQNIVFYIMAFFTITSAFLVINVKNPVHAVLFLIFCFFNVSGIFILVGAEYLAMTLIIVYVGAVAVLFLFVIMMLNTTILIVRKKILLNILTTILLGSFLFIPILLSIQHIKHTSVPSKTSDLTNTNIIGNVLYTDYFLQFQFAGLILLVSMIGAIVLTIQHNKSTRKQNINKQVSRKKIDCINIKKVKFNEGIVVDE